MQTEYKYIILGAGPSGLSFANRLLEKGEQSFFGYRKRKWSRGLCRSKQVDGKPLDIGGGHFLDVKNKRVLDFVFKFLPKKELGKHLAEFRHKAPWHWNWLPLWIEHLAISERWAAQISSFYFASWMQHGGENAGKFIDWISWKLGDKSPKIIWSPITTKIWSINLKWTRHILAL